MQLVDVAARGAEAVLWVLGECHCPRDAVVEHLLVRFVGKRARVPKRNVRDMRRRLRVNLVENFTRALRLDLAVLQDRRTAANLLIVLLDGFIPPPRNKLAEGVLERTERDQIAVPEQSQQKIVRLLYLRGATHVHEHYCRFLSGISGREKSY